jgi:hypothetical protein
MHRLGPEFIRLSRLTQLFHRDEMDVFRWLSRLKTVASVVVTSLQNSGSKFWDGLHFAMPVKSIINTGLQISLSRSVVYGRLPLFLQKLVFTLQIGDHFFLNLNLGHSNEYFFTGKIKLRVATTFLLK